MLGKDAVLSHGPCTLRSHKLIVFRLMSRFSCLLVAATAVALLPTAVALSARPLPNIVMFLTDDQDQMLGGSFPQHGGVHVADGRCVVGIGALTAPRADVGNVRGQLRLQLGDEGRLLGGDVRALLLVREQVEQARVQRRCPRLR